MHGRLHRPQVLQPAKFIIFNAQFIVLNAKFIVFDTKFIMFTHDHAPPPGLPAALGLQRTSSAERGRRARFRRRVPKPGLPPSLGPCGENGSPELRPEYGGRAPPPSPPPPPVSSLRGQIVSEKQEEKVGKKVPRSHIGAPEQHHHKSHCVVESACGWGLGSLRGVCVHDRQVRAGFRNLQNPFIFSTKSIIFSTKSIILWVKNSFGSKFTSARVSSLTPCTGRAASRAWSRFST